MLSLEVVGPGDSLSTLLICHGLLLIRQESVLAGGNSDGDIQLEPDSSGVRSSAGRRLTATTANGSFGYQWQWILNYVTFVLFNIRPFYSKFL
jgi:hypothetical protein